MIDMMFDRRSQTHRAYHRNEFLLRQVSAWRAASSSSARNHSGTRRATFLKAIVHVHFNANKVYYKSVQLMFMQLVQLMFTHKNASNVVIRYDTIRYCVFNVEYKADG